MVYPEACTCIDASCSASDAAICEAVALGAADSGANCIAAGNGDTCKYVNKPDPFKGGVYVGNASGYVGPYSGGDAPETELPMAATDGAEMCSMIVRSSNLHRAVACDPNARMRLTVVGAACCVSAGPG